MIPQGFVNSLALWSLISSIVSIAIAVFAIWIGWLFYKKGSEAETRAETALAGIKAQTETLAKITSSQIRQLTKAVTEQSPTEKALVDALSKRLDTSAEIEKYINTPISTDKSIIQQELISTYIVIYYYTALSNNIITYVLPHVNDEQITNLMSPYIDYTYSDFIHMEKVINKINKDDINKNDFVHLYNAVEETWKDLTINLAEYNKLKNTDTL
jgi:hypothetical protein